MPAYAHVRHNPIPTTGYLHAQRRHALREDKTSEVREGATPGAALLWRTSAHGADFDPRAYAENRRACLARSRASDRAGSALGSHFLIGVSPAWIEETGDLHDPDNPRNLALLAESVAWVESWAGEGAVFGARLDLDEAGGAVVDVFAVPVRNLHNKHGGSRAHVSIRQAQKELQASTGERSTYGAFQTSWHAWATARLDASLLRGEPANETEREHLPVKAFKKERDKLHRDEQQIAEREEHVNEREIELVRAEALLAKRERTLIEREWNLVTRMERLAAAEAIATAQKVEIADRQSALVEARSLLSREAHDVRTATVALQAAVRVLEDPTFLAIHPPTDVSGSWQFETSRRDELDEDIRRCAQYWPLMCKLIGAAQLVGERTDLELRDALNGPR